MAVRTTDEIELYIPKLNKILGFKENTHKWIAIRFLINFSLSIETPYNFTQNEKPTLEYNLDQIVGKGKSEHDYYQYYFKMVESFENIRLKNENEFSRKLEYHIQRGFNLLKNSIRENTDIYNYILEEFKLI